MARNDGFDNTLSHKRGHAAPALARVRKQRGLVSSGIWRRRFWFGSVELQQVQKSSGDGRDSGVGSNTTRTMLTGAGVVSGVLTVCIKGRGAVATQQQTTDVTATSVQTLQAVCYAVLCRRLVESSELGAQDPPALKRKRAGCSCGGGDARLGITVFCIRIGQVDAARARSETLVVATRAYPVRLARPQPASQPLVHYP